MTPICRTKNAKNMILITESQTLKSNFEYYQQLAKMDEYTPNNTLLNMAQKQCEKIEKYQKNLHSHFQQKKKLKYILKHYKI